MKKILEFKVIESYHLEDWDSNAFRRSMIAAYIRDNKGEPLPISMQKGLNSQVNDLIKNGYEIHRPVWINVTPVTHYNNGGIQLKSGGDKTYLIEMVKYDNR